MADLNKIVDDGWRKRFEAVRGDLGAGNPSGAVKALAALFVDMIAANPELETATVQGGRGARSLVASWPRLGADLERGTGGAGQVEIVFSKDTFSLSEAFTYYEFTLDAAIAAGL